MYNQLPSTVLRDATTFDIMILDVYTAWEKYKADPLSQDNYSEEDLLNLIKASKGSS